MTKIVALKFTLTTFQNSNFQSYNMIDATLTLKVVKETTSRGLVNVHGALINPGLQYSFSSYIVADESITVAAYIATTFDNPNTGYKIVPIKYRQHCTLLKLISYPVIL